MRKDSPHAYAPGGPDPCGTDYDRSQWGPILWTGNWSCVLVVTHLMPMPLVVLVHRVLVVVPSGVPASGVVAGDRGVGEVAGVFKLSFLEG